MRTKIFLFLAIPAFLALISQARAADNKIDVSPEIDAPDFSLCSSPAVTRRFVFVCDVSGTMHAKMPTLQRVLGKSIRSFRPSYAFNIILMTDDKPVLFMPDLVPAGPERRKEALDFLVKAGIRDRQRNTAALDLAILFQPEMVYLLADRSFPADAALANLRRMNPEHKVKVSVVALAASTDEGGPWLDHLKKIADENHGHFTRVDTDPHSRVFGTVGDACKIAFVSAAPLGLGDNIRRELSNAILALPPTAEFCLHVGPGQSLPNGPTLLPATVENQRKADDYLDALTSTAVDDPVPSLAMAFKQKPELLYLVTDGEFPDNDAVFAAIAGLNKDKKVKINTIAYIIGDDQHTTYLELLKKIARENGGTFQSVRADDH